MNAKKCDACGKLYEHYGKKTDDYNAVVLVMVNNSNSVRGRKDYDLCPECMKKVLEILKGGREDGSISDI